MEKLTSWLSACAVLFYVVLIFCVAFLYGVWGRKWISIVSVPAHCLFIYFGDSTRECNPTHPHSCLCQGT